MIFLLKNVLLYNNTPKTLFIALQKHSWQHVEQITENASRTPERGGAAGGHLQCTDSETQPCRDRCQVLSPQRALLQPSQTTSCRAAPQATGETTMASTPLRPLITCNMACSTVVLFDVINL